MQLPEITSTRFTTETGCQIAVQVPFPQAEALLQAVRRVCPLTYGHYDQVSFQTASGIQRFRSVPGGRNAVTDAVVQVPCVELRFFVPQPPEVLRNVLHVIYDVHPYEEPVILVSPYIRTLHITGSDEDNPNRFWNRTAEDWVPSEHR